MEKLLVTTKNDILRYIEENNVKFIRLVFCDLFGMQKNISIMPQELETAFSSGISFDASSISGFCDITNSDLFLRPELSTLMLLPWRPQQGRVARFYCSIARPDGSSFEYDSREILKRTMARCKNLGYECKIGAECEFYLFKTDENGEPTTIPFDKGGYFDMAPVDKGENVRREICLALDDMGIYPESSHHEQGPGQNEIDFRFSDPLTSADNFMTFKTVVKAIAERNGLFASFMPKPLPHRSGNGLHINISLSRNGKNIFQKGSEYKKESESFIAGILQKARQISLILNPIPNSYERLGRLEAPGYISWSKSNRSQLIRIPAATGERSRFELRSADPSINPYLAFAVIIDAGIYGIENNLVLQDASDIDTYTQPNQKLEKLPEDLNEAVCEAVDSDFVRLCLGDGLVEKFAEQKKKEAELYAAAEDKDLINSSYFPVI